MQQAEKDFRERMSNLVERIRSSNQAFQDEILRARNGDRTARRLSQDQINETLHHNNVEYITTMLEELHAEEGFLHDACMVRAVPAFSK